MDHILELKLTKIQEEVLTGLLLGDGCLFKNLGRQKKNINAKPILSVTRQLKDIEYLRDNFSFFKKNCTYDDVKTFYIFDKRTNKIYFGTKFNTRGCSVFIDWYRKWYHNGKKIVPVDLKLTPLTCAIWFCDDGNVSITKNRTRLKLSTHGFTFLESEWLTKQLSKLCDGSYFGLSHDKNKTYIVSSDFGTRKFIKYIENYIPISMNRKKTWNNVDLCDKISLPHLSNRKKHHFNSRELQILHCIAEFECLSPLEIGRKIKWMSKNDKKSASGISYYLLRFLKNGLVKCNGTANSYKDVKSYSLTNFGKEIYERISIDK